MSASVDLRGSHADFEVRVRRDGSDVSNARVLISSDLGDTELRYDTGGDYEGRQTGHASWYELDVEVGDDWPRARARARAGGRGRWPL